METLRRVEPLKAAIDTTGAGWWDAYRETLSGAGISSTAARVLQFDARNIAEHCILSPMKSPLAWSNTRLRRGLVLGSVQSGKTASMLAVAAMSIDNGLDIVVLLSGTQVSLWRQTYGRASQQLDRWSAAVSAARDQVRLFLPKPEQMQTFEARTRLETLYHEHPNRAARLLATRKPIVIVAMKQPDHLMKVGAYVRDVLAASENVLHRPLHLLVIDDEADDGSILDATAEAASADEFEGRKQIPRHIASLWAGLGQPHTTQRVSLFATYVAYTATPQANILQSDHNPLSPSDFVIALRTPAGSGSVELPRSSTFAEPNGIRGYYCGGQLFYGTLDQTPGRLCIPTARDEQGDVEEDDAYASRINAINARMLADALRAFFVAGAIRLHLDHRRLSDIRAQTVWSHESLKAKLPAAHTMLYHPSARLVRHFEGAAEVSRWSRGLHAGDALIVDDRVCLDVDGLRRRLADEEPLWREWVLRYAATAAALEFLPNGKYRTVTEEDWPIIRSLLEEEIFPHTNLSVVNSDPQADERPSFGITLNENGTAAPPRNIYTIFVSGNVMSRGLTLDGLCTTLFLRGATEPAADTQMQMQRWFGYRGKHLPFCRVFLYQDQHMLFRAYHENDEAMRSEIINAMNNGGTSAVSPLVLQGEAFVATRKLTNLGSLPLHPGPNPFVRVVEVEDRELVESNVAILSDLLSTAELGWVSLSANGTARGRIATKQLGLGQVAELLERFRYSHHDPSPASEEYSRWAHLEDQVGLSAPDAPLFRPPGTSSERVAYVNAKYCPFSIAAYLRFWSALCTRKARGLFPTDRRDIPWSLRSVAELTASEPRFYIGVRNGVHQSGTALKKHGILTMDRQVKDGCLISTWGSRGSVAQAGSYYGDQLFDYHYHQRPPPSPAPGEPLWRPRGEPGLVLFHVIRDPESGMDLISVGLSIPHGGPDHFSTLRSISSPVEAGAADG